MNTIKQQANDILFKSVIAAGEFQQFDQEATDKIVKNVFRAGFGSRIKLAKMAKQETGIGVWQHKVLKNVLATQLVYENIKNQKTVGVIKNDEMSGIVEIAQPLGPIFAIIPVTNPTSTTLYKILISLKTRNPIIISPPRRAVNCCTEAVNVCYEAALAAGAPEDCIQIIHEGSRELTHAIMSHQSLALTLARWQHWFGLCLCLFLSGCTSTQQIRQGSCYLGKVSHKPAIIACEAKKCPNISNILWCGPVLDLFCLPRVCFDAVT